MMQSEEELAAPVSPELPVSPEFEEAAAPRDPASPVSPESAVPEVSVVSLPEEEMAGPEQLWPPSSSTYSPSPWPSPSCARHPTVSLVAVESPELPEVEVVVGSEVVSPVPPVEDALPAPLTELTDGGSTPMAETLWGLAAELPDPPELLDELLVALDAPVPPVVPEVVSEPVVVAPEVAEEEVVAVEDTPPLVPPFPESPLLAVGEEVAGPEEAFPVFPLPPLAARPSPSQLAS